jgi:monoterpene epsilon-lactone hydrolase
VSIQNALITKALLPLLGGRRLFGDAERTRGYIADRELRPARFAPPRRLDRRAEVSLRRHDGWPVYELRPHSAAPVRHLLYLHGGAYINEIDRLHWSLAGRLVKQTPASCTVPIYPLGSSLGAARTVATAAEIATRLIEDVGGEQLALLGDSAGGGMALAVAQALREHGHSFYRLLLVSPWLDVATDRPEQRDIASADPVLGIPGLVEAGRTYAGALALDDPRVSPLHGDLRGVPPITVFTGTADLLNPDSHRLERACTEAGVPCELVEAPDAPHAYALMPTPEGRAARRRMVEVLRG